MLHAWLAIASCSRGVRDGSGRSVRVTSLFGRLRSRRFRSLRAFLGPQRVHAQRLQRAGRRLTVVEWVRAIVPFGHFGIPSTLERSFPEARLSIREMPGLSLCTTRGKLRQEISSEGCKRLSSWLAAAQEDATTRSNRTCRTRPSHPRERRRRRTSKATSNGEPRNNPDRSSGALRTRPGATERKGTGVSRRCGGSRPQALAFGSRRGAYCPCAAAAVSAPRAAAQGKTGRAARETGGFLRV